MHHLILCQPGQQTSIDAIVELPLERLKSFKNLFSALSAETDVPFASAWVNRLEVALKALALAEVRCPSARRLPEQSRVVCPAGPVIFPLLSRGSQDKLPC